MPEQPTIYYAVTRERGVRWDTNCALREQAAWDDHARFMDALVDDGFILLGGPLDDGERVLLIVNAKSPQEIETRLADDPWTPMGLLRIAAINRWEILLEPGK